MGNASSHVQYFFFAGATDPRIFGTGKVTPRVMTPSQVHMQSGNPYPSGVSNRSKYGEAQIEAGLDLGDLTLLLASVFPWKRETSGRFEFKALAGALPTGYTLRKQWTKMMAYNWRGGTSGPSYEAVNPTMKSIELNYSRAEDTKLTASYTMKELKEITQPTAPVAAAVDERIVLNSDVRLGLSAGRLGEMSYPTSILSARWTFQNLVEEVFGANQADRGWTDIVDADIQPTLNLRFMANEDYLDYALVDDDVFVSLSDAAGTFNWTHRARFMDTPSGPAAAQNIQEVEISFTPLARVDGRAVADLVLARDTAGDLTLTSGYMPAGLDTVIYNSTDDRIEVGTAGSGWPTTWDPGTIKVDTADADDLTYDSASSKWLTADASVAADPFSADAVVTIGWKWTPATFMTGYVDNVGVLTL